jgi:glutamate-1-semialdehyde 2,1-aminomutase
MNHSLGNNLKGDEHVINRNKLDACLKAEREKFIQMHPRSGELFEKAKSSLLGGVPMNWMVKWAGDYPIFVEEGKGAHFTDVDGHRYLDLCLGDTGAMTGHGPAASIDAIVDRVRRGTTFMLPTEEVLWVGE